MGIRFPALLTAALLTSCATPPKPPLDAVNRLWMETLDEWSKVQMERLQALEGAERDRFAEEHGDLIYGLALVNMLSILDVVGDSPWHGYVKIDGELHAGRFVTVRLSTCPPGRKFILYGSPALGRPVPRQGEESNDYWVLDLDRQTVEGEGTVDANGEAAVSVEVPSGGFRAWQARLLGDEPGLKGQAFTKAHGKRIR
jgi:hypothetical protein